MRFLIFMTTAVFASSIGMSAYGTPSDQFPEPTSPVCSSLLTKADSRLFTAAYHDRLRSLLKENVISEDDLALSTIVYATPKSGGKPFVVLIVKRRFYREENQSGLPHEEITYYTLRTGVLGRLIWSHLDLEKPGDYLLSNGQIAHVSEGFHRGYHGVYPTRELRFE